MQLTMQQLNKTAFSNQPLATPHVNKTYRLAASAPLRTVDLKAHGDSVHFGQQNSRKFQLSKKSLPLIGSIGQTNQRNVLRQLYFTLAGNPINSAVAAQKLHLAYKQNSESVLKTLQNYVSADVPWKEYLNHAFSTVTDSSVQKGFLGLKTMPKADYLSAAMQLITLLAEPQPSETPGMVYMGEKPLLVASHAKSQLRNVILGNNPVLLPALPFIAVYNLLQYIQPFTKEDFYAKYELKNTALEKQQNVGQPESSSSYRIKLNTPVKLNQIHGIDSIKEKLQQYIYLMKSPGLLKQAGIKLPKGVMLYGAPGTGKTMVAKAIASESGVPFFYASAAGLAKLYVGTGVTGIRNIFKEAREAGGGVIFLDEFETVGQRRDSDISGNSQEYQNMLRQMLQEMEGVQEHKENILVLVATNSPPDQIDSAFISRLDDKLFFKLPNKTARIAIIQDHLKGKIVDPNLNIEKIAKDTSGASGRDLEKIINQAAILALFNQRPISQEDVTEAFLQKTIGVKNQQTNQREEKVMVAEHELAHAFLRIAAQGEPPEVFSTVGREQAWGFVTYNEDEEKTPWYENSIADLAVTLAPYVRSRNYDKRRSEAGVGGDFMQAARKADHMVRIWGMHANKELPVANLHPHVMIDPSEKTKAAIDAAKKELLDRATSYASAVLQVVYGAPTAEPSNQKTQIHQFAEYLVDRETVDGKELMDILENGVTYTNPAGQNVKIAPLGKNLVEKLKKAYDLAYTKHPVFEPLK